MARNPFTPNFGQIPYYTAGREFLIDEVVEAFEAETGHPSLTSLFVGPRGTGKTALLSLLASEAEQRGWISVNVACIEGMLEDVLQQASIAAAEYIDSDATRRLKGVSIAQFIGLEWENESGHKPNWRVQMGRILDQLGEKGVGLLITVDEVDPGLDEMIQLASIYQLFVREGRKVSLLMAGLPSHIADLVDDKSVSFLRRASRYDLGLIEDYEVERAIRKTVESSGKSIEKEALACSVTAAGGFPYMIQLVGFRSWQEARRSDTITVKHVNDGIAMATRDMEQRVIRATLDELSGGDLDFLAAMLEDEGESAVADLARRLEKSSGYIARYRRRLINRGVIGAKVRGRVAFELPGLRAYLPTYLSTRGL